MPMKDAADRYSPEIADAFHPTETERPATKKSPVVFDVRAERNPIAMVVTTVRKENAKTQTSKVTVEPNRLSVNMSPQCFAPADFTRELSSCSIAIDFLMNK